MPSPMKIKRNELYEYITEQVLLTLKDFKIEGDLAEQTALAVVNGLAEEFGGSSFSFPKDSAYRNARRDVEIYTKFTGRNHRQLAQEYDLTENAIYKILKRVAASGYVDPRQRRLF